MKGGGLGLGPLGFGRSTRTGGARRQHVRCSLGRSRRTPRCRAAAAGGVVLVETHAAKLKLRRRVSG